MLPLPPPLRPCAVYHWGLCAFVVVLLAALRLPKTLLTLTQPRVASLSATVCVASVAYGADTLRSAAFFTLHSLLCRPLHCFEAGKPHIESEANGFDLVVDGTVQGFPFAFQSCEKASPARS